MAEYVGIGLSLYRMTDYVGIGLSFIYVQMDVHQ